MKGLVELVFGTFLFFSAHGQDSYNAIIDLKNISEDKATVEIIVPKINENTVIYQLPDITPGSYALYYYTDYIDDFKAYSYSGEKLPVNKTKEGKYVIKKAKALKRISYNVNDTWDDLSRKSDYIFPPGGTQINPEKIFLINHFGFLGFLKNYEDYNYSITYVKPQNLYASTPLELNRLNDTTDILENVSYTLLADNPVFYTNPDTLSFLIDKTKINITSYSPNKIITTNYLKPIIEQVSKTIKDFFGEIPIPEYSFYFYFAGFQETDITKNEMYGALEHKTSSVYFLPEMPIGEFLRNTILEIATHEFLHITTPLNLHSKEIENFNYYKPVLSSHLWMYEGVIEYLSMWLLYTDSLISKDDFILELRHKMIQAEKYKDVSFTEMSKKITQEPYLDMYNNVYNKGALIAFLLDIEINKLTNGEKNLQNILLELYEKYNSTPFEDDLLIDEIVSMVSPELKPFFTDYVIGNKPLPLSNYLEEIGWQHEKIKKETQFTFGKVNLTFSSEYDALITEECNPNQNMFHFEGGERIKLVNGKEVTVNNFKELSDLIISPSTEEPISLEVEKNEKTLNLEGQPLLMPAFEQHTITENIKKNSDQEKLNDLVFSKKKSL